MSGVQTAIHQDQSDSIRPDKLSVLQVPTAGMECLHK